MLNKNNNGYACGVGKALVAAMVGYLQRLMLLVRIWLSMQFLMSLITGTVLTLPRSLHFSVELRRTEERETGG